MVLFHALFFPGVLFHEFSHFITCTLLGVKVGRVRFTSVSHQKTNPWKNFFIAFAPFFLGTIMGVLVLWVGHTGLKNLLIPEQNEYAMIAVFFWLGFSILTFSFPSDTDARSAIRTLFEFYEEGLTLKEGRGWWLFCILTLVPLFVPLAVTSAIMSFFASLKGLGFFWGIIWFLIVGTLIGVW